MMNQPLRELVEKWRASAIRWESDPSLADRFERLTEVACANARQCADELESALAAQESEQARLQKELAECGDKLLGCVTIEHCSNLLARARLEVRLDELDATYVPPLGDVDVNWIYAYQKIRARRRIELETALAKHDASAQTKPND